MGHKVHPTGWRLGYNKTWVSNGYADGKEYTNMVVLDAAIRDLVVAFLKGIPVGNIFITHKEHGVTLDITTPRVSLVFGKNEENLELLKKRLLSAFGVKFDINVKEIKNPYTHVNIVAHGIARQIEKRLPYRRVIKGAIQKAMEKGAKGIKVIIGGRLNGAEIARTETYKEGNIPTQTIRSSIDYTTERAETVYGTIGIKVWIYKGDTNK